MISLTGRKARKGSIPAGNLIFTTLYDLIAAVGDEAGTGEDALVAATVSFLLESGKAEFLERIEVDAD
jgi:hypothetical protein